MSKDNKLVKNGKLNIKSGGYEIPVGNGLRYIVGNSHAKGGVPIGPNNKNGVEVEGGEVVQLGAGGMRVFSAEPFLYGASPAQLVLSGNNPNQVFAAQEGFKDRFGINDDGTMAQWGTEKNNNDGSNKTMPFGKMLKTLGKLFYDANFRNRDTNNYSEEPPYYPTLETLQYIKNKEGFRNKIYEDANGVPTIGYGTTQATKAGRSAFKAFGESGITEQQADSVFNEVVKEMLPAFEKATPNFNKLNSNQKNALFSYYFNVGHGSYTRKSPKLQKALRDFNLEEVANQMDFGYNDAKNPGLRIRRNEERELFNRKKMGGIHIDKNKRGTFTAAATKHGMGVQEFASRVLANKEDYSPAMVKKANFARNASRWKKPAGGVISINGNVKNGLIYTNRPIARGGIGISVEEADARRKSTPTYGGERQTILSRFLDALNWLDDKTTIIKDTPEHHVVSADVPVFGPSGPLTAGNAMRVGTRVSPKIIQQAQTRINRIFGNKVGKIGEKEFQQIKEAKDAINRAEAVFYSTEETGRPIFIKNTYSGINPTTNIPTNKALIKRNVDFGLGEQEIDAMKNYNSRLIQDKIGQRPKTIRNYEGTTPKTSIPKDNSVIKSTNFVIGENIKPSNKNINNLLKYIVSGVGGTTAAYFLNDHFTTPNIKVKTTFRNKPDYDVDRDVNNFTNRITRIGNDIYPIESDLDKSLRNIDTRPIEQNETPFVQDRVVLVPTKKQFNIKTPKVGIKKLGGNVRPKALFGIGDTDWATPINLFNNNVGWYRLDQQIKAKNNKSNNINANNGASEDNFTDPVWDDIFNEPEIIGERPAVSALPPTNFSDQFKMTIPDKIDVDGKVRQAATDQVMRQYNTSGKLNISDGLIGSIIGGLGSLGSYLISNNNLNRNIPKYTPVTLSSQKLKTTYNINPQLDTLREEAAANNRLIADNTANTRVALSRMNLINSALARANAEQYGIKENKENELENQDILNTQNVNNLGAQLNANLRAQDNERLDEWNEKKMFNTRALFSGINSAVNNYFNRKDQERYYNNTIAAIAARNPNVAAEIFGDAGVDWDTVNPYSTRNVLRAIRRKLKS